jgi:crotonobetainyl-CoA:carnitine CoA-transferase CaiB-like acyl-CoA transferase
MTDVPLPGPLSGLKVLDLTRLLPGPVATMHLADLGAEVIKIEGDGAAGDYARSMGCGASATEDSYYFRMVNRNKRSLKLDLKQPEGVAVFMRLAQDADVIVEGFRPGVTNKLGIGYEAVRAINPRLVYCAITGYGQTGPWAAKAGHDLNYIATAGLLDQIGTAGDAPAIPNLQVGDLLGGALTPLLGLLAAVIGAKTTGRGSFVDVAMTDALFAHMVFPLSTVLEHGHSMPRGTDLLNGGIPGYNVYRTSDARYLAVGALESKFWQEFCRVIARPDLAPFGVATGVDGERVCSEVAAVIAAQALAHWAEMFAATDCCVTPVLTLDEALVHAQLMARDMVTEIGGVKQYAPPFKLSTWPWNSKLSRPAPKVGADGTAILKAAGYTDVDISRLQAAGIV